MSRPVVGTMEAIILCWKVSQPPSNAKYKTWMKRSMPSTLTTMIHRTSSYFKPSSPTGHFHHQPLLLTITMLNWMMNPSLTPPTSPMTSPTMTPLAPRAKPPHLGRSSGGYFSLLHYCRLSHHRQEWGVILFFRIRDQICRSLLPNPFSRVSPHLPVFKPRPSLFPQPRSPAESGTTTDRR
jgi:hypothetical protein